MAPAQHQCGFTLVELVVFLVVISMALGGLLHVFNFGVLHSVDPVTRVKALEKTQALLDEILSRRFDENSPVGGVPACNSSGATACLGITADAGYDDVGDYNGYSNSSDTGYTLTATVVNAGTELGITNTDARRITVTTQMPDGKRITLGAYKVNY